MSDETKQALWAQFLKLTTEFEMQKLTGEVALRLRYQDGGVRTKEFERKHQAK
jgi:hypothetical protein